MTDREPPKSDRASLSQTLWWAGENTVAIRESVQEPEERYTRSEGWWRADGSRTDPREAE